MTEIAILAWAVVVLAILLGITILFALRERDRLDDAILAMSRNVSETAFDYEVARRRKLEQSLAVLHDHLGVKEQAVPSQVTLVKKEAQ